MAKTAQKAEEKVIEEKDTNKKVEDIKSVKKSVEKSSDINNLDVKNLLNIISSLQSQIDTLKAENVSNDLKKNNRSLNDEITIVCTTFNEIQANFPTWRFMLSKYGQKYTITRGQFQELYNTKYSWFKKRYIALDSKHMDYAIELDCPVYSEGENGTISPADIKNFANLRGVKLEEYYNNLSKPMKLSFASYFMQKCYEKDPDFYDIDKMNTMNHLTGGRLFDNLILACQSSLNDRK